MDGWVEPKQSPSFGNGLGVVKVICHCNAAHFSSLRMHSPPCSAVGSKGTRPYDQLASLKRAEQEPVPNWTIDSAKLDCEGQPSRPKNTISKIRIIYIMEPNFRHKVSPNGSLCPRPYKCALSHNLSFYVQRCPRKNARFFPDLSAAEPCPDAYGGLVRFIVARSSPADRILV